MSEKKHKGVIKPAKETQKKEEPKGRFYTDLEIKELILRERELQRKYTVEKYTRKHQLLHDFHDLFFIGGFLSKRVIEKFNKKFNIVSLSHFYTLACCSYWQFKYKREMPFFHQKAIKSMYNTDDRFISYAFVRLSTLEASGHLKYLGKTLYNESGKVINPHSYREKHYTLSDEMDKGFRDLAVASSRTLFMLSERMNKVAKFEVAHPGVTMDENPRDSAVVNYERRIKDDKMKWYGLD